ncbi:unnamed protein product [marine sediment metagenome]|uniref:Cyclic nucleotide-binding domain-containing protein n=1 Tax=marine sediment metagenome TaxID=412755 RepID=X0ZB14_9ZZZZ
MSKDVRKIMFQLAEEGHVFRLFSEEEVGRLSSDFKIYNYPAGEIVAKPGEALKMMGILVSGEVFLEEKTELKGNWIVLYDMKRGSILAHPSLFDSEPPPVRITAQQDTVFLGIDGASFDRILQEHPQIGITFLKEIIRVLFISPGAWRPA